MPPDMDRERSSAAYGGLGGSLALQQQQQQQAKNNKGGRLRPNLKEDYFATDDSLECIYTQNASNLRHIRTDFSYLEQPIRGYLQPHYSTTSSASTTTNKMMRIACNNKNGVFLSPCEERNRNDSPDSREEFCFIPDPTSNDGTVWIQNRNKKKPRFLCSDSGGSVYVSETLHDSLEQWRFEACSEGEGCVGFYLISVASQRRLACFGNIIRTVNDNDDDVSESTENGAQQVWTMDVTSGELCFLSSPCSDKRLRCDLTGKLSLSSNYLGWEAWRFSEAGNGLVRISPWAHANHFLSCNEEGQVTTTHKERGEAELWSIQKAPLATYDGVIIQSAKYPGRYLSLDDDAVQQKRSSGSGIISATTAVNDSAIWQMESLHRSTYYLVNTDCNRRLVGTEYMSLDSSKVPVRRNCEEWTIIPSSKEMGVVHLYSKHREGYLASDDIGNTSIIKTAGKGWTIMEGEDGTVIVSKAHNRMLVCTKSENSLQEYDITTIPINNVDGDNNNDTTTTAATPSSHALWRFDPRIPRQVTKEKMAAVGAAVAVGVATTVATPLVLGGVIGMVGVAEISVAGRVAVGSIRAAEALSTATRIAVSSSQLASRRSMSSVLAASTNSNSSSSKRMDDDEEEETRKQSSMISNRPFSEWQSW